MNEITMCPYCKKLFDIRVGNLFKDKKVVKDYNKDNVVSVDTNQNKILMEKH